MSIVRRSSSGSMLPRYWDRFFNDDVFGWGSNFLGEGQSLPAVNIKETDDSFHVEMAAPGLKKSDFKISLDGTALSISAEKQSEQKEEDGEYSRKEFSYQSFYRAFNLPKDVVDADKIKAKYEEGILKIEVPKKEEAKEKPPRTIDVE